MSEALVFILVFSILFILNLCGLGLYHYQWRKGHDSWKNNVEFGLFTGMMFLFGVCYLGIAAFTAAKKLKK